MQSSMEQQLTKSGVTYSMAVRSWSEERENHRYVQPYTAKRSVQKALLFEPWIGDRTIDEIEPEDILCALAELGSIGGKLGKGLSSATLRAAHLAGSHSRSYKRPNTERHYDGLKFHELRHTHFTMQLAAGIDIPTAQALGGWSTADVLLNVYAHPVSQNIWNSVGFMDRLAAEQAS